MAFLLHAVWAPAQAHVPEPAVNLGDTSFLDGIAGPGIVVEEIGDGEQSNELVDGNGHRVSGSGQANSISSLTHIAWISRNRFLGGWYGAEVVVAAAHVNAGGAGLKAGGWGDLTVSPFILQWNEKKLGAALAFHQRVVLDLDLPTGEYSRNANLNLSRHVFTIHPYYAVTAFALRRTETSWRVHYLWSSKNMEPPTFVSAQSIQAGQAIHFNATISYEIAKNIWLGSNGYLLEQISDAKVRGVALRSSPEQVGAIGPGMVWQHGRWSFYLNGYHEIGAQNRPTGNKLVLRAEKVF
jgi:hypothetical protein